MKPTHFTLVKPGSRTDAWLSRRFDSAQFSYQEIFGMFGPLLIDQFFIFLIGMLTTSMISSSSQESVSAVSLVGPLTYMVIALSSAVASGGTVVVAQYKGKGDQEKMRRAAGQVVFATCTVSFATCALMLSVAGPAVNWMFGAADAVIREKATAYTIGFGISMIPFSLYNGVFAVLRGVGDTKTCLRLTVIINLIHLFASMLFLNVMKLDILGTTLSYNIARLIGGGVAVCLLVSPRGSLTVPLRELVRVDWSYQKSIFQIGIPLATEQMFFYGGSLIVQSYISGMSNAQIAANAITNSSFGLFYSAGLSVSTLAITVVGQCIGAGDIPLAKKYGRQMILLGSFSCLVSVLILGSMMPLVLSLYSPHAETLPIIYQLVVIGAVPLPFVWALSNVTPNILRAAGDANFTSVFSLITMWVVRVGMGYLAAVPLGFGIHGVWIAMGLEWVVRAVVFSLRFRGDKWYRHKVV